MNRLYGLIGFPLGHSFSARYFTEKFQRENLSGYEYRNFPLESIRELPAMLENHPGLLGFNVTIPYKQEVIPFLTALSAEAREIGAVNCVKITPQGLYGHNTDAYGFRKSLLGLIGPMRPDALILGTGGASKAVGYVLRELGIAYTTVSQRRARQALLQGIDGRSHAQPSADRQCNAAGHLPEGSRMSRIALRDDHTRPFPVRPGLQPTPDRIPAAR
jgi:shikimate 5-dehydrogenase